MYCSPAHVSTGTARILVLVLLALFAMIGG